MRKTGQSHLAPFFFSTRMTATVLVIQHVPHERLGTFEPQLRAHGCDLVRLRSDDPGAVWPRPETIQGVVVMGGPQSVYEGATYPWLAREMAWLRDALKAERPILGVCLGAQLLAAALGAKVTKAPQKEIGWYPVMREPGADGDAMFAPFGQTETVFQWHGDTFALPKGAVRLASSPLCAQQAFRYGAHAYGVQFHVEVTEAIIRAWMRTPVNRQELHTLAGIIDPMTIKRHAPHHAARLQELSRHVAGTFAELVQRASSHRRSRPHASSV